VAEIVAQRVQKSFAKQIEKTNLDNKQRILFIGSASYPTHATHGHGVVEKSREALTQAENEDKDFVSYGHTD
jgi:predicted phosphodiesterase